MGEEPKDSTGSGGHTAHSTQQPEPQRRHAVLGRTEGPVLNPSLPNRALNSARPHNKLW